VVRASPQPRMTGRWSWRRRVKKGAAKAKAGQRDGEGTEDEFGGGAKNALRKMNDGERPFKKPSEIDGL
jgi:hypothetical protein